MKIQDAVSLIKGNNTSVQSRERYDTLIDAIKTEIKKDGRCQIPGLGTLTLVERAPRTSRNPRTNETVEVPAKKTVKFKPTKEWKAALQG